MEDIENKLKRIQETALDNVENVLTTYNHGNAITETDIQMFDRSIKAFLTVIDILDEI
jgi:glutathionyl-hydroquinone reductase